MAKCKFKGTDPLHFKTYDCTAAAKTDDGYCKRHEFSLNRTLDLIKRVGELEAQNKRSKQNTDHWQHEVGKLHSQIDRLKAQHTTLITELRNLKRYKYGIDYDRGGNKFAECYDDDDGEWIKAADITALLDKEDNSDG